LLAEAFERRRFGPLDDPRTTRRAYAYLIRRGFPRERVFAFLRSRGVTLAHR